MKNIRAAAVTQGTKTVVGSRNHLLDAIRLTILCNYGLYINTTILLTEERRLRINILSI